MTNKVLLPTPVADAIRDMLPQNVSAMLRAELEKGAQAIDDLAGANTEIGILKDELDKHQRLNTREKNLNHLATELALKKEKLAVQEFELNLKMAELMLGMESKYSKQLEGVLAGLVRNTAWREQVHMFEKEFTYGNNGNMSAETSVPKDTVTEAE